MWWFGVLAYMAIGFGSYWGISSITDDGGWLQIAHDVLWLPCGAVAFGLKVWVEQRLLAWIPDDKPEPPRDP